MLPNHMDAIVSERFTTIFLHICSVQQALFSPYEREPEDKASVMIAEREHARGQKARQNQILVGQKNTTPNLKDCPSILSDCLS